MASQFVFQYTQRYTSREVQILYVSNTYLRVTPLTTDTTPLNYNTRFHDRTVNHTLNSIIMNTQRNFEI